jgi:hypothetical protein
MNIVELEAWRKKEDNRDRELLEHFSLAQRTACTQKTQIALEKKGRWRAL